MKAKVGWIFILVLYVLAFLAALQDKAVIALLAIIAAILEQINQTLMRYAVLQAKKMLYQTALRKEREAKRERAGS